MAQPQPPSPTWQPSYSNCDGVSALCPLDRTIYAYRPNLGGAVFFLIMFTLPLIVNFVLAFKMKNYGFSSWLLIGIALEVLGYGARVALWDNPWDYSAMVAHLTGTVIAPSFVNAAISVTFKHIALYCGEEHLKLRAKYYPFVFIGTDFTAIFIQVAGAGMSAAGTGGDETNSDLTDAASAVLVAGVSFQVVNMVFCGSLILLFAFNYQRSKKKSIESEKAPAPIQQDKAEDPEAVKRFRIFVWTLFVSFMAVLIRCCYRIPEMAQGWTGDLMQTEPTFLVLDSSMMVIAVWALTVTHPAIFFRFMAKKQVKGEST
ncbi:hypothetical protein MBLNU230_g0034t1 [Neophaeotheca triangularis]